MVYLSRNQRGFTLIEILISALILALVATVAFRLLAGAARQGAALAEAGELEDRRSVIIDVLQMDVDRAGKHLSFTSNYGSGVEPAVFLGDPYYTSSSDTTYASTSKTGPSGWNDINEIARAILGGDSYVTAQLNPGSEVSLDTADGVSSRTIRVGLLSKVNVFENGVLITVLPQMHSTGDSYRIAQAGNASGQVVVNYYQTHSGAESLIYTSAQPVMPYPLSGHAAINTTGTSVTAAQISGAVLADRSPSITLPPLPVDSATGQRLSEAITITTQPGGAFGQAVVIAGDPNIDPVYTLQPYNTTTTPIALQVATPRRGSFQPGDYVLLVDPRPSARACCLYRVSASTVIGNVDTLTLDAMTGSSSTTKAWGRLYSNGADLARTYPATSALARLSPLVTYKLQNGLLVRSVGYRSGTTDGESATTVAPGITNFSIQAATAGTVRAYNVAATAATEGYNTPSNTEDLSFTVTPRALTRPAEWQSQLP